MTQDFPSACERNKHTKKRHNDYVNETSRYPWEPLPNESARKHGYFVVYRDMKPAKRTLQAVADEVGLSESTIRTDSYKFKWVARAKAHDAHVAGIKSKAETERGSEEQEQLYTQSRHLLSTAMAKMQSVVDQLEPAAMTKEEGMILRTVVSTFGKIAIPVEHQGDDTTVVLTADDRLQRMAKIAETINAKIGNGDAS